MLTAEQPMVFDYTDLTGNSPFAASVQLNLADVGRRSCPDQMWNQPWNDPLS
jgi:hypothetical protein